MSETESAGTPLIVTGEATALLPVPDRPPVIVIGTEAIRRGYDARCLEQAVNAPADRA